MSIDSKYMSGGAAAKADKTADGGVEVQYKCPLIVWDRTNDPKGSVLTEVQSWRGYDGDSYFAINGKKFWTAEQGNDGELPGYVHDHYLFEFDDGSYGPGAANSSTVYDTDETGKLGETFVYNIGDRIRAWSLDGELLFDGTKDEWKAATKK